MKFFKFYLFILSVLFLGFAVWMNLTPGYFQETKGCCNCQVEYVSDTELENRHVKPCIALCVPICRHSLIDKVKIMLAYIDFYR